MDALIADLIRETTDTTGSVLTLVLDSVLDAGRFSDAGPAGTPAYYSMQNGNNRELGIGTIQAGNTFDRTTPLLTLVAGVYDDSSPARITLVGTSTIVIAPTAMALLDGLNDATNLSGQVVDYFLGNTPLPGDNFSLDLSPAGGSETTVDGIANSAIAPVFMERYISEALGGDSIEAGVWDFHTFASVDNNQGVSEIKIRVNRSVLQDGTVTVTGTGLTRTFTATEDTWVSGDADPDILEATLIETPNETFWIDTFVSPTEVTAVTTDAGYVNESAVEFSNYYKLFAVTTGEINGSSPIPYQKPSFQQEFAINPEDKLLVAYFAVTTSGSNKTLTLYKNGTEHYSHISTPLIMRHDQMAGLNDGNFQHVTLNEKNRLAALTDYAATLDKIITDVNRIEFSLDTDITATPGVMTWNQNESTVDIGLNSNVTLQVGQEFVIKVRNNTGITITNGLVLMAVGTLGSSGRIVVAPHDGTIVNANRIIGIATETILTGEDGFATIVGKVRGFDTSMWSDGDILYVTPDDDGLLTSTVPDDTQIKMPVAFVVHSAENGTLYVRVSSLDENGFKPWTQAALDNKISFPEAPEDNKTYGRNNAAWVEVVAGGGGATDSEKANIALNSFNIAVNGGLTMQHMVDGMSDVFTDESGVDTGRSVDEIYNTSGYYTNIAAGGIVAPNPTYDGSYDVTSEETSPRGLRLSADETKLYVIGPDGDEINQYTIVSKDIVANAPTFDGIFNISSESDFPTAMHISNDGTKLYVLHAGTGQSIKQYSISSKDFVSSPPTFDGSFSVSSQDTFPTGLFMSADETKLYVVGNTGKDINQYSMTSIDIVANAPTFDGVFNTSGKVTDITDAYMSADQTRLYVVDATSDDITQYSMTSIDIVANNPTYIGEFYIGAKETWAYGIFFSIDNTKMYIVGFTSDRVHQYSISSVKVASSLYTHEHVALATPDSAFLVLHEEDVDPVTLNTDLSAWVSRTAELEYTVDFAVDNKLGVTGHGFSNDDRIFLSSPTGDNFPAGWNGVTPYFVINATTNDFEISLTSGGAAVAITSNGSGTLNVTDYSQATLTEASDLDLGRILIGTADLTSQASGTEVTTIICTVTQGFKLHALSTMWS